MNFKIYEEDIFCDVCLCLGCLMNCHRCIIICMHQGKKPIKNCKCYNIKK